MLISLFYIGFTLLMLSSILTHFVFTPILSESFEPIKLEVYEKVAFIGGCGILHNRFAGPEF